MDNILYNIEVLKREYLDLLQYDSNEQKQLSLYNMDNLINNLSDMIQQKKEQYENINIDYNINEITRLLSILIYNQNNNYILKQLIITNTDNILIIANRNIIHSIYEDRIYSNIEIKKKIIDIIERGNSLVVVSSNNIYRSIIPYDIDIENKILIGKDYRVYFYIQDNEIEDIFNNLVSVNVKKLIKRV